MSHKELKEVDFDKLRFIRVFTPMHVPKELIEQVRDREFEVDDWYKYQEVICVRQTANGPQLNPLSMLYVIADDGNKVVGMLWCEIDTLGKTLVIQTFSMDKKYWCRGKAVTLLSKKAKEILKECKLKRAVWISNYPKHSERYGFKRSRGVLMEYKEEEDGQHNVREHEASGRSPIDDSGTAELSRTNIGGTGSSGGSSVSEVSSTT